MIIKTLLRSVMPTVQKFVDSGKIDALLQELKARYASHADVSEGETVEILITTEADRNEYANVVVFKSNMQVKELVAQQRLSHLVSTLFTEAEL